ncbi:MAG: 3'(2'),5'-bisphosphate nucleotidase CysQ [Melioribacteraceae bacterium]|nr:3'(2'),5'-bisphosphate nucleotidase CysQ [Melioribacteraceae bacterium]MCF8395541.1 3'(2'),5'-bisphosphate nucleotidase CysQ [Melioribacteraceae bacterium]MCF8420613.1 3'(2'),5'-bisphosphate nucleotidase CysQ [Melioribacteraceae bacterium]
MQIDIQKIINISKEAGKAILDVYNSDDFNIESKDDNSPLTLADKKSHEIISNFLKGEYPEIPVLSEEGKEIDFNERKNWEYFWLVDPLDGTKEFIKRNGEFTVNIALIKNHTPILGVIFVPVTGELYFGKVEEGAFKQNTDNVETELKVSSKSPQDELIVVQSRSHSGEEENEFYSNYKIVDRISKGSSLKICMVAEGKAEIYFRSGPTWEWDTAAGHAILNAAGGHFVNKNFTPLVYNKEVIKNFGFIASSFPIK